MIKFIRRLLSPPMVAALIAVIIMSIALMFSPVIGMADNGDFGRITNGNGIYKLDRGESDEFLDYSSTKFGLYQYYNEYETTITSSQTLFIVVAKALDSVFTTDAELFDIRFLSALFILYCAAAIYMLVDYTTFHVRGMARYVMAVFVVFFFADTGYSAYFNSFYAEGLVMVSFLMSVAALLLLSQKRYSPYGLLTVFFSNALILTFSKQQNAPVGVLLAVLLLVMLWTLKKDRVFEPVISDSQALNRPYIRNKKLFIRVTAMGAALLTAAGIAMYVLIPELFVNINQYHAMTRGILMSADNPEDALEKFDIDRQYALLNKTIYFERYPAVDVEGEALDESFYSKLDTLTVLRYYVTHPGQLISMIDLAAKNAYFIRPDAMGNYERSENKEPGEKTDFFTFYSTLKQRYAPRTFGFILIWTLLIVFANFRNKSRAAILLFCMLNGLMQLLVSIVGAGDADLSKHVFLYNVSFDLTLYLCLCSTVAAIGKRIRERYINKRIRDKKFPKHAAVDGY